MATPISMPQGMAYGWWHFPEPFFNDLTFKIEIISGDEQSPGRYYQLYQGQIGGVGMYFGFQTYLRNPYTGSHGRGLIFSRWNSSDEADCAPPPGGWSDKGEENGKYVGVRSLFDWKLGCYLCWLRPTQEEINARWYEFCVHSLADGRAATVGSLRFPNPRQQKALIHSGGCSWTEVYSGVTTAEDVPLTQVIVHSIAANNNSIRPVRCDTNYNPNFPCADCFVSSSGILHLNTGKGVSLIHPKQSYVIDT